MWYHKGGSLHSNIKAGECCCTWQKLCWPLRREGITQAYVDQAMKDLKHSKVAVEIIKAVRHLLTALEVHTHHA